MPERTFDRVTLVNMVLVMEGALLLFATVWSQLAEVGLAPALRLLHGKTILIGLGAGVLLAFISTLMYVLAKYEAFKFLRGLRDLVTNELVPIFSTVTVADVLLIAVASGFCEEIFFRGVIQEQFGLVGASIMFGFLHSPSFKYPQYGIWAFIAGLLLGWLYIFTNSLWAPIIAHVLNNILGLLLLRYIASHTAPASKA